MVVGAFDFESFDKYVRWILSPVTDVVLSPPGSPPGLKMHELTLTRHTDQRKQERFLSDRDLQEFHRVIQSKQDSIVYNQSLLNAAGFAIISVSETRDGKKEPLLRGLVHEIFDVDRLVALMDQWNSRCGEG